MVGECNARCRRVCGAFHHERTRRFPLFAIKRSTQMTSAKGLEGVVVAQTHISHVFGEEGRLVYRGYEINELA
ncbi:MAG TPA: citrate/2-methylcitrate synthase, partial [Ktedonobacterales bacterium]